MAKITLSDIADIRHPSAATTINSNNALIETAIENTLSRDGKTPNTMSNDLDMNNNQILNLPTPNAPTDVVRLQDVDGFIVNTTDKRFATDQEALDGVSTTTLMSPKLTKDAIQQSQDAENLGTAAYEDIGTSGNKVPKLNAMNTWTGQQKVEGSIFSSGSVTSTVPPSSTGLDWSSGDTSGRVYALGPNTSTPASLKFISYNSNATVGKLVLTLNTDGTVQINQYTSGGILCSTATGTLVNRTITGTANEVTVASGTGVSANPTISLPTALTFTGKTVTGGTFNSGAFNGTVGATTPSTGAFTTLTTSGLHTLNGGQIKFPATASLSANPNTLDDYEEGAWTPALDFGGNAVGLTYNASTAGRYVKIGRTVWLSGLLFLSAKGSSTGVANLTGLPFTRSATGPGIGTVGFSSGMSGLTGSMSVTSASSGAAFNIYQSGATGNSILSDPSFTDTSRLYFNAWYETDS